MDKKHIKLSIIGFAILLIGLVGVTYSFFNYTKTGVANVISTGGINFSTTQSSGNGTYINLSNVFPIDVSNGIPSNDSNVGEVTINVSGNTDYTGGIEYLVSAVNVTNTVPISIDVSVEGNTTNNTILGTVDADYFSHHGTNVNSSIYKILAGETILNNDQLLVGYIKSGSTGADGNIVIKAYIDADKVLISDTYNNGNTPTDNLGTPAEMGEDKTVFTTTEWNALQSSGISFQIKIEAREGTWVENPNRAICIRATTLHTEECNQSSNYCNADGYYSGGTMDTTIITYGNLGTSGNDPVVGDAFDCDVDGTGYNQRFYYVSPYYNTDILTFDDTEGYATLIYYSNTISGVANDGGSAYDSTNENWHGPATALTNLPTSVQWSNITLKNTSRAILAEGGSTHNATITTYGNHTLPTAFSYSGYAARLLTAQELMSGCGLTQVGSNTVGEISTNCKFLMEETKYSSDSKGTYGPWLETPQSSGSGGVWFVNASTRYVVAPFPNMVYYGVRPVIDVPYSRISY